ncbi:LysR family transcriptional regulator [Arenicella xantha]|uniref:LysR family transcriptional regulator n=1 Tax=Arenicella xantha TaxID=644221 RepID=A0A395JQ75_9GAMM|nr:LysR family transcriptional regulator [Arenicella xantha]RBP50860.1 LysR family transcriptional regulator [Arenicella xantha]
MDINAFKTFLEVAKTRHFGRAANNLCVTQSAVSARIKALEESLGAELFIRERSNIHLSPSGEALVIHASSIVDMWNRARQEVSLPNGMQYSLNVGGLPGLWDILLQDWLNQVLLAQPDLAMNADIYSADVLVEKVLNRSIDLAFFYDAPHSPQLTSQIFSKINLRLVSSNPDVSIDDAIQDRYIYVDWGTYFGVQHAAAFPSSSIAKLYTSSGRIAFEAIKANGGAAYLAEPMVRSAVQRGEISYVADAPVFERAAYAVFHQSSNKAEFVTQLLQDSLMQD